MKKFLLAPFLAAIVALFVWVVPAWAQKPSDRPSGLDDRGPLTKITFIHYRKGYAKPPWAGGGGTTESTCYGFLGKGVLWKSLPQHLYINAGSLNQSFVDSTIDTSAKTWDGATGGNLYGGYTNDPSADWETSSPDYKNEISFGPYSNNGVIAVTNVWGYFGGPPQTREIVDFDILFNTFYSWGDADVNPAVMDLQNIATHEMGHGWGLDDQYSSSCSAVTMYGYSDFGETSKRTLEQPDINGIQSLYGI